MVTNICLSASIVLLYVLCLGAKTVDFSSFVRHSPKLSITTAIRCANETAVFNMPNTKWDIYSARLHQSWTSSKESWDVQLSDTNCRIMNIYVGNSNCVKQILTRNEFNYEYWPAPNSAFTPLSNVIDTFVNKGHQENEIVFARYIKEQNVWMLGTLKETFIITQNDQVVIIDDERTKSNPNREKEGCSTIDCNNDIDVTIDI